MVNEFVDKSHLFYVYLLLIKQHLKFRLSTLHAQKMLKRCYYFFYKKTPKNSIGPMTIWNLTIKRKRCPWITQEVEYAIQNKGLDYAMQLRMIRLAMFYIVIKNKLYFDVKSSIERRKKEKETE